MGLCNAGVLVCDYRQARVQLDEATGLCGAPFASVLDKVRLSLASLFGWRLAFPTHITSSGTRLRFVSSPSFLPSSSKFNERGRVILERSVLLPRPPTFPAPPLLLCFHCKPLRASPSEVWTCALGCSPPSAMRLLAPLSGILHRFSLPAPLSCVQLVGVPHVCGVARVIQVGLSGRLPPEGPGSGGIHPQIGTICGDPPRLHELLQSSSEAAKDFRKHELAARVRTTALRIQGTRSTAGRR